MSLLFDDTGNLIADLHTCADCGDPVPVGDDFCDACAAEYPPCCQHCGFEMEEGGGEVYCPRDCDREFARFSGYSDWCRANC